MRRNVVLLAAILFLATAAPTFGKAGASIAAPDGLSFGDSFMPTWVEPNGYEQRNGIYLFATLDCFQDGRHVQGGHYVDLTGTHEANAGPFTLGNPGYWDSGPASCVIRLFTFSFQDAREKTYATDGFEVAA